MKKSCLVFSACLLLSAGCTTTYQGDSRASVYSTRHTEEIKASLFESDKNEITQEAVNALLSGKVKFPDNARVAVYKMSNVYSLTYKYYGYASEERLDTEQEIFQTVCNGLAGTKKIQWIKPMPSILTPTKPTISKLREAAVRLQADTLVVFSVSSDIFTEYRLFSKDEVKAYSTCEMIAFDTKTGVIPFSEVITKKIIEKESAADANIRETQKRAEKRAVIETLKELSSKLKNKIEKPD